jgi:hypothetical protein
MNTIGSSSCHPFRITALLVFFASRALWYASRAIIADVWYESATRLYFMHGWYRMMACMTTVGSSFLHHPCGPKEYSLSSLDVPCYRVPKSNACCSIIPQCSQYYTKKTLMSCIVCGTSVAGNSSLLRRCEPKQAFVGFPTESNQNQSQPDGAR